jgi:hypothetical protein
MKRKLIGDKDRCDLRLYSRKREQMITSEIQEKLAANFIYRVVRLPLELKPYIPVVGTGLRMLLSSWEFPITERVTARNMRVSLSSEDAANLAFLMQRGRRSAAAVICAALLHAQQSHVRPRVPSRCRQRQLCAS